MHTLYSHCLDHIWKVRKKNGTPLHFSLINMYELLIKNGNSSSMPWEIMPPKAKSKKQVLTIQLFWHPWWVYQPNYYPPTNNNCSINARQLTILLPFTSILEFDLLNFLPFTSILVFDMLKLDPHSMLFTSIVFK